jgi:GNAT superfamily N-acetyltransferase
MPVTIRPAPQDFDAWEALLALLHRAFAFQQGRIDPPSSLHRFDPVSLAVKARDETLFLAFEGAQVVGCIFAKPQGDALYVGKFAVEPGCQGRGIGRQLMGAAEDLARRLSLPALELETRIELTENHRTFAAMGFVRTAENAHAGYDRPTSVTMRKQLR